MTAAQMTEFRNAWAELAAPLIALTPQVKHEGSHAGEPSVKVEGPQDFVDGVLTALKPLLDVHDTEGPQGFAQRLHVDVRSPGKPIVQRDGTTRDATNPSAGDNVVVRFWVTEKVPGAGAGRPSTFDEGQPTAAAIAEARGMTDEEFAAGIEALRASRAA